LPAMFSLRMQNAKDDYLVVFDPIENFVRKPAGDQTSKTAVIKRTPLRIDFQQTNGVIEFDQ